ncbi:hypothetical protein REH59_21200 [Pseudomonas sp. BO3-4]|uniref:hypothetical protein n=1 Tax=Pseudomonas sp. BO3-4 TaxID=3094916 RepID=UPI002A59D846|nr:hypothetical protein [Pseudomonas sp. BO3-4]WPO28686.1 hypothetical protein REH59_21200 [Pseudomonas sp. BO3-4]
MSPSKTKKNNTRNYSYTCATCDTPFTGHREQADKSKRFCKDSCRKAKSREADKAAKRQSRIEVQKVQWSKSTAGQFAISQCRREGSVAILWGNTTASLVEFDKFIKLYKKCHGYDRKARKSLYHRCHIQASRGTDGSTGALHYLNLFIGLDMHNQKAGNKFISVDAGLRVPASKFIKKWEVTKGDTSRQIVDKIHALLGDDFTNYVNQRLLIKMDTVHELAKRIYNRQQKGTAVKELERRYTLSELEQESLDDLEKMDALQRGNSSVASYRPESLTRAPLCVYADELERVAAVSLSGRHRDNCLFMLDLVRVLGAYIAQAELQVAAQMGIEESVVHERFMSLKDATWEPLAYLCHLQPWGRPRYPWQKSRPLLEADRQHLINSILEHCYNALAGADVPRELLRNRLSKRLYVVNLVPTVQAPDKWRYKASGGWDKFLEGLYSDAEPIWQALLALDLCTPEQLEEARTGLLWSLHRAIEKARRVYRASRRVSKAGCPEHLEYPPILIDLMQAGNSEMAVPLVA